MDFESDFWGGIEKTVSSLISSGGKVSVDPKSGVITVTDAAEPMKVVESYVEMINKALIAEVERREAEYNSGETFAASEEPLSPGRPIGF